MKNLRNFVILRGNLGKDPELRVIGEDKKVVTISLATQESYQNKKGDWINSASWHMCTMWDKLADRAMEQLKKGNEIIIQGKIQYDSYEDKNGIKRRTMRIVVRDFTALAA